MKQYGFYIDSSKCTGCKTCQLSCKDFKDLGVDRSFRRVYEYAGGNWVEENGTYRQTCLLITLLLHVTTVTNQLVQKCAHQVRCTNVKMVLSLWMRRCVLAVNTVLMLALTVLLSTAKKKVT